MFHDANTGASRQAEHGNPLYDVLIDVPQHLRTQRGPMVTHITYQRWYTMYVVIQ